jgi:hypothetical protein
MATLEACNASSKLVILRSQTSSPYGVSARIPSIMLPGLFVNFPAGQLVPATPKAAASAFISKPDETDWSKDWSLPSPKFFSSIDPALVSSGPLRAVMTLKDWCSHCTSVSIQPQTIAHIDPYS